MEFATELEKKIQKSLKDNIFPIYHIFGADDYLIERAFKLVEIACNSNLDGFNKTIFNDENFNAEIIINSCNQVPFLAEKRLVVIKNMTSVKESEIKKMMEYAKSPSPDCVLVICENAGLNLFKKIDAQQIECKKLSELELHEFIKSEISDTGKTISADASNLLINFCLKNTMLIKNELIKLCAYCNTSNEITLADVKLMVHENEEYNIFEISEALSNGDGNKAINLLNQMLENTEFPVVLSLIYGHFRRMYYSIISEGSDGEIATKLGVKPFAITKAKMNAKKFKPRQLADIISIILDVDYSIKDGKMNAENAMYYMVFQILALK